MPRRKHRLKSHESRLLGSRDCTPPHPPPERPRSPARNRRDVAPILRAVLAGSLTLVVAVVLAVLLDESEASAAARNTTPHAAHAPPIHRALRLDGASALRLPGRGSYLGKSGAFTVECWVRGAEPTGNQTVVGNRHFGGLALTWSNASLHLDRPTAWLNMSKVPGTARSGYLLLRPTRPWKTTRWTHLAFVHEGRIARLFVDGRLSAEGIAGGRLRVSDLPLYIGADPTQTGSPEQFFTGEIDDVRISTIARYTKDFTPPANHAADEFTSLLVDFEAPRSPYRDASPANHVAEVIGTPRIIGTTR